MKRHHWLAPFACALFLATTQFQPLVAQAVRPDIRAAQADGKAATIITFDVPGSVCGPLGNPCPSVTGIDAQGTVAGSYFDADQISHGFYRLAGGMVHSFHLPEPGCLRSYFSNPDDYSIQGCTFPEAMNQAGFMTGSYLGETGTRGFIRDRAGNYTTFDAFNAPDIFPSTINSAGTVAGSYYDPTNEGLLHGFVRDAAGNFTTFDAPNYGFVLHTTPQSINSQGDIVGLVYSQGVPECCYDTYRAFLRQSNGTLSLIAPNHTNEVESVFIADNGLIIGNYSRTGGGSYGFIRDLNGVYTTFNIPGASNTFPVAVDPQGSIVGYYSEPSNQNEWGNSGAFYRLSDGTFGLFNIPGALGIFPTAISAEGNIAGYYIDAAKQGHGFIRINPDPPPTSPSENEDTNAGLAQ